MTNLRANDVPSTEEEHGHRTTDDLFRVSRDVAGVPREQGAKWRAVGARKVHPERLDGFVVGDADQNCCSNERGQAAQHDHTRSVVGLVAQEAQADCNDNGDSASRCLKQQRTLSGMAKACQQNAGIVGERTVRDHWAHKSVSWSHSAF